MDFALSPEQQQFAASVHDLLAAAGVQAAARDWAGGDHEPGLAVWRSLAGAGVTGLMVPAGPGGLAAGPVDLVIACEEIGHHAVPGPVAESLAAVPLLLAGVLTPPLPGQVMVPEAKAAPDAGRWLRQLADGELLGTLAAPPVLPFAADAEAAGLILVAEPGSVRTGVAGLSHRSVDATRTVCEVTAGEAVAVGQAADAALAAALEYGTLACAAELLGAGRALLEAAARHARQRVQFGQPVGAFQAVKHHLADVLIGLEFARPLLFAAAVALVADPAGTALATGRDVSAAKVACTDAAARAARVALQVHGAIGYTAEHDLSLYLTKVRALGPAWGSQSAHRARVLAAIAAAEPAGTGPGEAPDRAGD